MKPAHGFRRRAAVSLVLVGLVSAGLLNAIGVLAAPVHSSQATPAAADVTCTSGAHTLSLPGSRVYPEMGNGGYTSVHTDVHMVYDATANLFLPGNHVDLTITATQCLSDFSFDFERVGTGTAGPNMTADSVTVDGSPATFAFVQPTYAGDPNGQNDPDPAAHAKSNVNPVSATNPNPPACSPNVNGAGQNGTQCPANKLVITPAAPIASGQTIVVTINYTGRPGVHNDGDGTTEGWFRSNSPVGDGSFVTTEPVGTMAWMPLNNHPTAKPSYDFYDTVNVGKVAIANGELVSSNPPATNPPDANFPLGSVTWIWHNPEHIANYLVENSVGAYDLTSATSDGIVFFEAQGSSISASRKATNQAVMDQQPAITRLQAIFNGPFPATTNGVVVGIPSASFEEEMQGKITFNGSQITLGTFHHENMHQWFGDNVSEAQFNLTFWKEGWATIGEYINAGNAAANGAGGLGTPAGDAAFDTSLRNRFNTNYGTTNATFWTVAPSNPTVGNLFTTANTYTRPGTAYLALRQILDGSMTRVSTDRWIKAMKQIQSQYGGGTITEQQLEDVFHGLLPNQSAACQTKLNDFFTQWFDTPYPGLNTPTNKPQITGPGINGPDHFYDDTSACTRADQTITFAALVNKFVDDADFQVSASSDSGLTVTFAASGPCTVTGTTVHLTGTPGACTITASQAGDGVFKPATDVPQTFQVTKHPQTITFTPIADRTYGDPDFVISPTSDSGLTVAVSATGNCSLDSATSPATVHITGAGSCSITASQAGDATRDPAADVIRSFLIAKADQTITFAPIGPKAYLDPDFGVAPTASSGLTVALTAGAAAQCSVSPATSPATVHIVSAGSCTVTASQAGDTNYNPAPSVPNVFSIGEATIVSLTPVHTWVSLKNGDDVGTSFDVKVELLKNGTVIETGLSRCITGIGRAAPGKVIDVPWTLVPATVNRGDILSLRVSTRIGTVNETTKCAGHNSAAGLRLYYDSTAQASRLGATIGSVPTSFTEYLRSNGNVCNNAESTGVTSRTLDATAPAAAANKCKDSALVNFAGGNPYKEIGTWGTVSSWILP